MFQGSSDQYRQFYFWLLKLKVDEGPIPGACLPAGLLEILKIKPTQPKLGLEPGAELEKQIILEDI